ncbi:MAG TPA: hypothetical protein VNZ45_06960 [Bacteroidia bacterium]|jgi:hypothetical protein|nr:hypothetical protein [Bacteroidia bacterium]
MENTTAQKPSGGWKVMGILSVVLGGLSILFSFIPCLGAYAMYSGVLATIISIVAFAMANSAKASKTMAIIGLVISIASIGIGYWRYTQLTEAMGTLQKNLGNLQDSLNKKK